jgi:hypothetical protein
MLLRNHHQQKLAVWLLKNLRQHYQQYQQQVPLLRQRQR